MINSLNFRNSKKNDKLTTSSERVQNNHFRTQHFNFNYAQVLH